VTFRSPTFSLLCVVFTPLLVPTPARAECIQRTAKMVMQYKGNELVFSGTVVQVTRTADLGYRATFEVDRVWKGSVPARFDLHVWELAPEIPRFELGRRYVVLAHRLIDSRARQGVGLGESDAIAFTPTQCSDPASLGPTIARDLGEGLPPN